MFQADEDFLLIQSYYENGITDDPEPFRMFLERCQAADPVVIKRNNLNYSMAMLYFRSQKWEKALEYFEQAKKQIGIDVGLYYRIGQCQLQVGQFRKAIDSLNKSLAGCKLTSLRIKILMSLVETYNQLGWYTSQDKTFNKILFESGSGKIRNKIELLRAETDLKRKQTTIAIQRLIQLISRSYVDESSIEAMSILKKLEKQQGHEYVYKTNNQLKQAAHFCYRIGDFSHSLALLEHYRKKYPSSSHSSFVIGQLGHCHYRLGNYDKAIYWYGQKLKFINRKNDRLYYLRKIARCYQSKEQYKQAIGMYKEVIEAHPRSSNAAYALLSLAYCYELTEQLDRALETYQKLEKQTRSSFLREEARFRQAMTCYTLSRFDQSFTIINQMSKQQSFESRQEDVLFWQIKLYNNRGDLETVHELARQFIKKYPSSVYRNYLINNIQIPRTIISPSREQSNIDPLKNPYEDLNKATRYAAPRLDEIDPEITRSQKLNEMSKIAQYYRFHFDIELAIEYFTEYQRKNWKDIPLLLTLYHFHWLDNNPRKALYYADAIRSLFTDYINWEWIEPHLKRLFFPFPFAQHLTSKANDYNLSPCLLSAIIHQESRFNDSAISSAGARGLMQIMPETGLNLAREIGQHQFELDMLLDIDVNTRFGSYYMKKVLEHYHGVVPLALAAYNGGQNNVDSWSSLMPQYESESDLSNILASIRYRETRNYVKKILINYRLYSELYCSTINDFS